MNEKSNVQEDINQLFDNITLSENHISNEAFQEGVTKGYEVGKIDGYHLGYHKGLEIGCEMGFYNGFTKTILMNNDKITVKNKDKVYVLVNKLKELLENFPEDNHDDVDITKAADDIRACYRKLASLLKLNLSYPVSSAMSF